MKKRFIAFAVLSTMLFSSSAFAQESTINNTQLAVSANSSDENVTIEDINSPEDFSKNFVEVDSSNVLTDAITRGTSIPTSVKDLGADTDTQSYSFVNYIYSNYKYIPDGSSIDFGFSPTTTANATLTLYNANTGSIVATRSLSFTKNTWRGFKISNLSKSNRYYFKLTSTNGSRVSGTYVIG